MKNGKTLTGRILAMTLLLTLMLSAVLPVTALADSNKSQRWQSNVLAADPLTTLVKKKEKIISVTFLDTLEDAPEYTRYLGKGSSPRVQGWVEWNSGYADVYIAAKGGINAKNACYELFRDCKNLEYIDFNNAFHTDEVTTMQGMFRDCKALEELDVSSFNTENVTSMNSMFSTCTNLKELDLSNFDTSKVRNMAYMFSCCRNLETVDVSSFDTSRVTRMEVMFRWCSVLEEPDLSGWNVSRVKDYSKFMDDNMYINGEPWKKFFR